jgi:hypothetical protein
MNDPLEKNASPPHDASSNEGETKNAPRNRRDRFRLTRKNKTILLLLLLFALWFFWPRPVKISEETTHWTEPVDAEGKVDYAAIYAAQASEGVTPENNAALPLVETVGVERLLQEGLPEVRDALATAGVDLRAAMEGDFVDLETWFEQREVTAEDLPEGVVSKRIPSVEDLAEATLEAVTTPWDPERWPEVDSWLQENRETMERLREASRRTHFYLPLAMPEQGVLLEARSIEMHLQPPLKLLRIAAMKSLFLSDQPDLSQEQRNTLRERALDDLEALARWGNLYGKQPHLYQWLVGNGLLEKAHRGLAEAATRFRGSEAEARRRLEQFRQWPRPLESWEVIDFWERMISLDSIVHFDRFGTEGKSSLGSFFIKNGVGIDRNVMLRMLNETWDSLEPIARMENLRKRLRRAQEWEVAQDERRWEKWKLLLHPSGLSRTIGVVHVMLMIGSVNAILRTEAQTEMYRRLTDTALILEVYRAAEGDYPASLEALVPDYLDAMPRDAFGDGPLKYERREDGYTLYSNGRNVDDDGGDPIDEADLVVQVGEVKEEPESPETVD